MESRKQRMRREKNDLMSRIEFLFNRLDDLSEEQELAGIEGARRKRREEEVTFENKKNDFLIQLGIQAFFEKIIFTHTKVCLDSDPDKFLSANEWFEEALNASEIPSFMSKDEAFMIVRHHVSRVYGQRILDLKSDRAKNED